MGRHSKGYMFKRRFYGAAVRPSNPIFPINWWRPLRAYKK